MGNDSALESQERQRWRPAPGRSSWPRDVDSRGDFLSVAFDPLKVCSRAQVQARLQISHASPWSVQAPALRSARHQRLRLSATGTAASPLRLTWLHFKAQGLDAAL